MRNQPQFTIVIPVYNNAATLKLLAEKIHSVFSQDEYELIFVDDSSKDNSAEIIERLNNFRSCARLFSLKKNIGQWDATLYGMSKAAGEYIITLDADLQYRPEDIKTLYRYMTEKKLLVLYGIPKRMLRGWGGVRIKLQNFILGKMHTSSFKILHRSCIFGIDNSFLPSRHFEAHEKFEISQSTKGWLEVNDDEKRKSGFRRHLLRNINILLTYLPEYDMHFRHPFILPGAVLSVTGLFSLALTRFSDSKLPLLISFIILISGFSLLAAGIIWRNKYKNLLADRKRLYDGQ